MLIDDTECCIFKRGPSNTKIIKANDKRKPNEVVGSHTKIFKKVVLACFEDFACVPYCRNDKDMTTHEGPPKFNYFRTYFSQIY